MTVTVGQLELFCQSWYPAWDRALADELKARLRIDPGAYLPMLSRGTRLKVAFLLALAPRPRLLVLDEPFSGLDPVVRDDVTAALLDVTRREGSSIIISSHEMDGSRAARRSRRLPARGTPARGRTADRVAHGVPPNTRAGRCPCATCSSRSRASVPG